MIAWGCWIAVRAAKPIRIKIRALLGKKAKPDPVVEEYNRLKSLTENT
jgi:hypothetical protein